MAQHIFTQLSSSICIIYSHQLNFLCYTLHVISLTSSCFLSSHLFCAPMFMHTSIIHPIVLAYHISFQLSLIRYIQYSYFTVMQHHTSNTRAKQITLSYRKKMSLLLIGITKGNSFHVLLHSILSLNIVLLEHY